MSPGEEVHGVKLIIGEGRAHDHSGELGCYTTQLSTNSRLPCTVRSAFHLHCSYFPNQIVSSFEHLLSTRLSLNTF